MINRSRSACRLMHVAAGFRQVVGHRLPCSNSAKVHLPFLPSNRRNVLSRSDPGIPGETVAGHECFCGVWALRMGSARAVALVRCCRVRGPAVSKGSDQKSFGAGCRNRNPLHPVFQTCPLRICFRPRFPHWYPMCHETGFCRPVSGTDSPRISPNPDPDTLHRSTDSGCHPGMRDQS